VLELVPAARSAHGFTVHAVRSSAWSQRTLTYANAPRPAAGASGASGRLVAGRPVRIDVTRLVARRGVRSLALVASGSTRGVALGSSRAARYLGPRLVVTSRRPAAAPSDVPPPLAFPVHAAFYYPWFPEQWGRSSLHTRYHPSAGRYSSDATAVVDTQIDQLDYAGLDVAIASWWGPGTHAEERRIPELLDRTAALGSPLRWALYYEPEGQGDPTPQQLDSDLGYVQQHYAGSSRYARIAGKPVIFVFADGHDGCGMVDRWSRSTVARGFYVVLRVFPGYRACANRPDSWHQYGPAAARSDQKGYSFTVSPGFWKWSEPAPRLARDLPRFRQDVDAMVASGEPWQLVTTFNEWGEGTAVEPASEWASSTGDGAYLDVLHAALTGRAAAAHDPVVAAAGDIACAVDSASFDGGDGTKSSCRQRWTSDLLLNMPDLAAVLPLGDVQYECGESSNFAGSYDPSWGRLLRITHWATGNHEYGRACGRDDNSYATAYFGVANPRDWYSYDVGAWHVVVLNSECGYGTGAAKVGGCGPGSAQEAWLRDDLAANRSACTLAYWHEPRFSSGEHGDAQQMATLWNDLVAAHADVVLSGHNHDYERFEPIGSTPGAASTSQDPVLDPGGIREFVVGTGGKNHYPFHPPGSNAVTPPLAGEVVRNADTYGVLELTLHARGYDWRFVNDPGSGSFTDSGSGVCH